MVTRVFELDTDSIEFPSPNLASSSPNGLLAIGGDLSPKRLINAYCSGIFPWFSPGEPFLWWSPDPRAILELSDFHVSKSLKKIIKRQIFKLTVNKDFASVIYHCAKVDRKDQGTWITDDMIQAYCELHRMGWAQSIEVWHGEALVGGLYGVRVGNVFCGESMFHLMSNASKVAYAGLVELMKQQKMDFIDCQILNDHTESLGATEINRSEYLQRLGDSNSYGALPLPFPAKELDMNHG